MSKDVSEVDDFLKRSLYGLSTQSRSFVKNLDLTFDFLCSIRPPPRASVNFDSQDERAADSSFRKRNQDTQHCGIE
jgi:hypothetical protein